MIRGVGAKRSRVYQKWPVVDLVGGYRDGVTRAPWQRDSMVNMFSTTKGIAALTVAHAVSRDLFDYDAAVADYWPEFGSAAGGAKADVTVRQLLAHQAGLCALKPAATLWDVADPRGSRPSWRSSGMDAWHLHGYHAITSVGIGRTHPPHRPGRPYLGRYLAEEIAGPLGPRPVHRPADGHRPDRIATHHHWKRFGGTAA